MYAQGDKFPFTVEIDDPSGNSFIKNPYAPSDDPQMKKVNLYIIYIDIFIFYLFTYKLYIYIYVYKNY